MLPAPRCGSLRRQLDPAQAAQRVARAQGQGAGVVVAGFAQGLIGEQPGPQWIGRLVLGGAVDEHQQLHGPGERHIGQPLGLLRLRQVFLLPRPPAHAPAGVQGNVKAGGRGTRGRPAHARGAAAWLGRLPEIGTDHHGELQPLAAVHRHHPHGRFHRIAVGLMPFRRVVGRMAAAAA